MLAGAHVADGPRLLAVAGQPCGRQLIERHAFRAAGEVGLAHVRPAEDALQGSDVEVLARVGAGHDRELDGLEVEGLDPAGLDEGRDAERLDAAAERHEAVRVTERPDHPAPGVDLDDVAAMDALLDSVADLPDEDRRHDPRTRRRSTRRGRRRAATWGGGCGHEVGGPPTVRVSVEDTTKAAEGRCYDAAAPGLLAPPR